MTEAEWLACEDPARMLRRLSEGGGTGKLASWWGWGTPDSCGTCGGVGHAAPSARRLRLYGFALWSAWSDRGIAGCNLNDPDWRARQFAWIDSPGPEARKEWNLQMQPPLEFAEGAVENYTAAGVRPVRFMTVAGLKGNRRRVPLADAAHLAREVFGNPFRPAARPGLFTPGSGLPGLRLYASVLSLAHAAYGGRDAVTGHLDNARLGVLSDALEEAGCADDSLLSHLRSPGPHVRGCWALDLILGKE